VVADEAGRISRPVAPGAPAIAAFELPGTFASAQVAAPTRPRIWTEYGDRA
jgi:hypothetical protein